MREKPEPVPDPDLGQNGFFPLKSERVQMGIHGFGPIAKPTPPQPRKKKKAFKLSHDHCPPESSSFSI